MFSPLLSTSAAQMSVGESQVCTSGGAPAVLYKFAATHVFTPPFFFSPRELFRSPSHLTNLWRARIDFLLLHLSHEVARSATSQAVRDIVVKQLACKAPLFTGSYFLCTTIPKLCVRSGLLDSRVGSILSVTRKHSAAFTPHTKTDLPASLHSSSLCVSDCVSHS